MLATEKTMEKIVALCKSRGFVYPGSEIYGGLSNSWDYGPLGVEFKNNVKRAWWKKFVQESPTNVGLDAAILMNPSIYSIGLIQKKNFNNDSHISMVPQLLTYQLKMLVRLLCFYHLH